MGLKQAKVWVALSDGGSGLEAWLRSNFPNVDAVILDFFHAAEYLGELSRALHGSDEAKRLEQTTNWSRMLQDQGGAALIGELESFAWPNGNALKLVREEVLTYFRNQVHRMDYPTYRKNGWYIGSGAVESACKTVVGQRMKGSGMRWSEAGAHAVCHVRALYRSESSQWTAFWRRSLAK